MDKKTMEEVINVLDGHITLNAKAMIESAENGEHEKYHAHAGGITALKLLKRELTGERVYTQ